jgi:hypothetical protein
MTRVTSFINTVIARTALNERQYLRIALLCCALVMNGVAVHASPEVAPSDAKPPLEEQADSPRLPQEARMQVTDKRTARSKHYTVLEGRSFTHETLEIKVKKCWSGAIQPYPSEYAALVEIHEATTGKGGDLLFTGWIFAEASELSNLQHQAYDVALVGCEDVKVDDAAKSPEGINPETKPLSSTPKTL